MVAKSDKEKVKTLLSETIRLLCKNGLHFKSEFCVEALVGITLDQDEEFFLSIKETVKSELVSSTKESVPHRKSKSERRSKEYVVKGEPSLSSCHRKRPTNANTSDNEDLGELALGEMHEGEQQFWTSVTEEGDGDEGGGVPVKKRHIQIPDESSSSNQQIVVKGEPDSDSDIEEVASTSQEDNQPMNLLPGSFSFPGPSTSGQSFMGNIPHSALPQQVWDQLPPFSTLPGTSGIPSAPSTVTSPDGHQQGDTSRPDTPASSLVDLDLPATSQMQGGLTPREIKQQRLDHMQKDPYFIPRLMRRIMLTKGREITPKQVYWNFSYRDRPSVALIHQVMKELDSKGLGTYGTSQRKTTFAKKEPWSVQALLESYGINIEKYEQQFYAKDVNNANTYTH